MGSAGGVRSGPSRDEVVFLLQLVGLDRTEIYASSSVLHVATRDFPRHDPFSGAITARAAQRAELARCMRALPERERELLFLWYVQEQPVARVAAALGVSRAHCYRLRDAALAAICGLFGSAAPAA